MKKILSFILPLAFVAAFTTACQDDGGKVTIPEMATMKIDATVSTLTFTWDVPADVDHYTYSFEGDQGELEEGKVMFEGLEWGTKYTLYLNAYGKTGSVIRELKVDGKTTAPAGPTLELKDEYLQIYWNTTPGAAYSCIMTGPSDFALQGNFTAEGETIAFPAPYMEPGTYTVRVTATATEAAPTVWFTEKEVTFTIADKKLATVDGFFREYEWSDEINDYDFVKEIPVQIGIYQTGKYVVNNFYGGNKNFEFAVNLADWTIDVLDSYSYDEEYDTYYIVTGITKPATIGVAPAPYTYEEQEYCNIDMAFGDPEYGNYVDIYAYGYFGEENADSSYYCFEIAWNEPEGSGDEDDVPGVE